MERPKTLLRRNGNSFAGRNKAVGRAFEGQEVSWLNDPARDKRFFGETIFRGGGFGKLYSKPHYRFGARIK